MGSVFFHVDYSMPIAPLRAEVERIVRGAPEWDQRFFNLVVTEATEKTVQLRVLCTAASSGLAWDLRCVVREGLIDFMQREYPQFLPRLRIEGDAGEADRGGKAGRGDKTERAENVDPTAGGARNTPLPDWTA
jgi:hypothetical protein